MGQLEAQCMHSHSSLKSISDADSQRQLIGGMLMFEEQGQSSVAVHVVIKWDARRGWSGPEACPWPYA